VTRSRDEITAVLGLVKDGVNDVQVARLTGIPRSTVRDWRRGRVPVDRSGDCDGHFDIPPEPYAYLLGIYLGDGCLSLCRRDVWKLRVVLDTKYPGIIDAVSYAMSAVRPGHPVGRVQKPGNCLELVMHWKHWPCLFPQHGPGRKHERRIALADWQARIVEAERPAFLCGLIDSDGCRIVATYREKNATRKYGRYVFSNRSEDIHRLFTESLQALGIHWTRANWKDTAVARQRDVRKLDDFIGFKE
jgi:hypothetical protein